MRRASLAVALVSLVLAAPPAHADVLVEVGLRVGYLFGRGWVVGPDVSLVRTGASSDFGGFGYRYAQLLDGAESHEVDLDVRTWAFPFHFLFDWPNHCGVLGAEPKRVFE